MPNAFARLKAKNTHGDILLDVFTNARKEADTIDWDKKKIEESDKPSPEEKHPN